MLEVHARSLGAGLLFCASLLALFGLGTRTEAEMTRPLKYYGADEVGRTELATIAQYRFNTATVSLDVGYQKPSDWLSYFEEADKHNINLVVWPTDGQNPRPDCSWGAPYHGDDISAILPMLDVIGNHPRLVGIVNAHEAFWTSCPMTIEEMASIRSQIKDYVRQKHGRDIDVWNYVDNIYDRLPAADIGRIMDVAYTWQHCVADAEGTCENAYSQMLRDRARINEAGLDGVVDLVFAFQTFSYVDPYVRMPTAEEMYYWGGRFLQSDALDGFYWYSWGADWYDADLDDRPDLWDTVSRVYTDFANVAAPPLTFEDVPRTHPYYDEIEWLYGNGYTAGCNTDPLRYCPEQTMNRAESAVFVERGIHAASYDPPTPASAIFADMPLDSWAANWVNGLWADQYTAGCGTNPLIYCPWQGHTRAEGCVFYLRMLRGANYEPAPPSQRTFADVPLDAWYAKWVQAAYDAALLTPCQTSPEFRLCPNDPLSRGLAAYMMYQAKSGPAPMPTPTATPTVVDWYRGNSHTHSQLSDTGSADDTATIAGWYKNAGYDFLIISDHNDDVATKQIFCHDELSTSTFLMLCGSELSYSTHTLAFNIDQFIKGETSLQDAVTRTLNGGGVPIVNHPYDSGVTATKFLATNGLNHFEVVNGGRLDQTPYHEALWDAILSAANGRIAYAVASDDNHSCSSCVGRGWIMVKAPALTKQDIEDNLRSGNFYATTGILLNDYIVDKQANTITVDSQNGETITFIGNNGSVLSTVQGKVATYHVVGTEKYVRVKITNAAGKAAWTQPVYVSDL